MSYYTVAEMTFDPDLRARYAGCAALEGQAADPWTWVDERIWAYASQPGWADAYASAQVNNVPRPGLDPGVITDAQILAATQAMLATP